MRAVENFIVCHCPEGYLVIVSNYENRSWLCIVKIDVEIVICFLWQSCQQRMTKHEAETRSAKLMDDGRWAMVGFHFFDSWFEL